MAFACIYVPDFMVQAVERCEPLLRSRPLALIEGLPPAGHVVAASKAAARAGIELGMAQSQAAQFHGIEIRERSHTQEDAAHEALLDLGWSFSPRVEDTAPDTILLDLAGLDSLFGSEENIAHQLKERAYSLGLVSQVAISVNLEVAQHAAHGFSEITCIPQNDEAKYLGTLPVTILSPSVEIQENAERWGVRTCGALAALPVLELSERLGQQGVRLHQLARGAESRSLVVAEPALSFREEMDLDYAVAELDPLSFLLGRLLDQLCARLAARSLSACAIHVQFRLEASGKKAATTFESQLTLPVPSRDSKMLLKLLRLQLQSNPPLASILTISLAADSAKPRVAQGGLFLPSSPDPEKLELTIARLAHLVGNENIGTPKLMDTHRPGAFRMAHFLPHEVLPEQRDASQKNISAMSPSRSTIPVASVSSMEHTPCPKRKPPSGFRMFRPAPPASVELRAGHPFRVSFSGLQGQVLTASGPWCTSGDWWREDAWRQDEWDLEVCFATALERSTCSDAAKQMSGPFLKRIANESPTVPHQTPCAGLYRLYYDHVIERWFVRGVYD